MRWLGTSKSKPESPVLRRWYQESRLWQVRGRSKSTTSTPEALRQSLSLAYGETGSVSKRRTLFLVGRTRVHLDRVQGLGHFLELEVVLGENESSEVGTVEAHELMLKLGVDPHQLVEGAYVGLLAEKASFNSTEQAVRRMQR